MRLYALNKSIREINTKRVSINFKTFNNLIVPLCAGSIPFLRSRDKKPNQFYLRSWARRQSQAQTNLILDIFVWQRCVIWSRSRSTVDCSATEGWCTLLEKLFSYTKLTSRAPSSRFRIMHTLSRCQRRASARFQIEEQFVCNRLVTFAERVSITARALSSPLTPVMRAHSLIPCTPPPTLAARVISYTSYAFFPLPLSTLLVLRRTIRVSVALLLSRGICKRDFFALSQRILNEIIVLNNYQSECVLLRWCEFFSLSLSAASQPASCPGKETSILRLARFISAISLSKQRLPVGVKLIYRVTRQNKKVSPMSPGDARVPVYVDKNRSLFFLMLQLIFALSLSIRLNYL